MAAVAGVVLALASSVAAQIPLERFDGQPFEPKAPPEFACRQFEQGLR